MNSTGDERDMDPSDGKAWVNNDHEVTLRSAIQEANRTSGPDAISFNIPGGYKAPGTDEYWIVVQSEALPVITETVYIDGYTQPGSTENTNPLQKGNNARPNIVIDGTPLKSIYTHGANGIVVEANDSTIQGLVLRKFPGSPISATLEYNGFGIILDGDRNVVQGCFLGTGHDGHSAAANAVGIGVFGDANEILNNVIREVGTAASRSEELPRHLRIPSSRATTSAPTSPARRLWGIKRESWSPMAPMAIRSAAVFPTTETSFPQTAETGLSSRMTLADRTSSKEIALAPMHPGKDVQRDDGKEPRRRAAGVFMLRLATRCWGTLFRETKVQV